MRNNGSVTSSPRRSRDVVSPLQTTNLTDLLERVLDKGLAIAGDVTLFLGGVQLLTLRIRLLVASIDKAQELGINWWQFDPALSSRASSPAKDLEQAEQERKLLKERFDRLERTLLAPPQEADRKHTEARQRSNAASGYALDQEGRVIAELKPLHEDEQPQTPEQAPQPGAARAEQPAGAAPLLGPALHAHIAQAMRPVLGVAQQGNARAPRSVEQGWPQG
jgi:hypothetical protein